MAIIRYLLNFIGLVCNDNLFTEAFEYCIKLGDLRIALYLVSNKADVIPKNRIWSANVCSFRIEQLNLLLRYGVSE